MVLRILPMFSFCLCQGIRLGSSPEMYAGRVACCLLVSHVKDAKETDGWTPDLYNTLSVKTRPQNLVQLRFVIVTVIGSLFVLLALCT